VSGFLLSSFTDKTPDLTISNTMSVSQEVGTSHRSQKQFLVCSCCSSIWFLCCLLAVCVLCTILSVFPYVHLLTSFSTGFYWLIFCFLCSVKLCRALFVLSFGFLLTIILSAVLRFRNSDYPPLVSSNFPYCILIDNRATHLETGELIRKGWNFNFGKQNISVVICGRDIP
jgi:hypothetical protein